jgi:pimeloyl-ACP methyl ester carboxylesterase
MALRRTATRLVALAAGALATAYAAGRYATARFEDLEPESAGAPGTFATVRGVRLHYIEAGRGPAIVLIHGWNGSTFAYRHVIPDLARQHRVIAIDLQGFGYSQRPANGDYSVTAQVELIAGLMDHLAIERADVAGHSMGGAISMSFALRYPERVSRLVLIDSASIAEMQRGKRLGRLLARVFPILALVFLHPPRMRLRALRIAVHDPAVLTPDMIEGHFRPMRMKGHLRGLAQQTAQRGLEAPIDPSHITHPTLILWGEHDRVIPSAQGTLLASRIPQSNLQLVRSAAHLPLEEQPGVCARLLVSFLASPGPAPARSESKAGVRADTAG